MTAQPGPSDDPTPENDPLARLALPRRRKAVLVVDLVESVRWMERDEIGVINAWRSFVQRANDSVLPRHRGRLVKSLGDGLMADFDEPRAAVAAAVEMHRQLALVQGDRPPQQQMLMRAGLHLTPVWMDDSDIFGAGVNLAARVTTLAEPGGTVGTAELCDELIDGVDAQLRDLGVCYLKHVAEPVRAYGIAPVDGGAAAAPPPVTATATLQPTVAVLPFVSRSSDPAHAPVGDLLADAVIAHLGRTPLLQVIARLSTEACAGHAQADTLVRDALGADYAVGGSHMVMGDKLLVSAMLTSTRQAGRVLWSERFAGTVQDLLEPHSELAQRLSEGVHQAILERSVQQAQTAPLPTLESHALLLGGIRLMHRSAPGDFSASRRVLDALVERHPRAASSRAWLAKWHVLASTRGLANDRVRNAAEALDHTRRALDTEPANALALAMEGFVQLHLQHDLGAALQRLDAALQSQPSEPLAWLFRAVALSFDGQAGEALGSSEQALRLSPLDPLRYYFESLAATCALGAGRHGRAVELCEQSLRRNRYHASTLRALITAHMGLGQEAQARARVAELLQVTPGLRVSDYLRTHSAGLHPVGLEVARALRAAGVPD